MILAATHLTEFFSGAAALASLAVALFFLRYWRETRDRFFALFGLAFAAFGLNRFVLALLGGPSENRAALYLIRLVAFLLILIAIVEKNRETR